MNKFLKYIWGEFTILISLIMITIVQLEYIIAVDTYRHFVTAAEKCFITQPTLSMQIKKMEDLLNINIFDRTRQPVVPTDIGQVIIRQARIILREYYKLNEVIKNHQNILSGEIKIGIIPTLAPYLLPRFISGFAKSHPELSIKVEEIFSDKIINELKKDLIDIGILVTPIHEEDIVEEPLFYEEIKLYTHQAHPFSKKEKIGTNEIVSPDLWLLSKEHCFRNQVINLCSYHSQEKSRLPFQYESGSLSTLKKMVDVEGGFTLLPELAIDELCENNTDRVKSFKETNLLRQVSLVHVNNFVKEKLLSTIGEHIRSCLPQYMLDPNRGTIVEWR